MAETKALTQQEIDELGSAERIDKSMRERFEPALEALNTAYDAYIAADETFTDSVEAALAKAAIEVKDAGLAVAGGLESLFKVIQGAVTESDDPDRWEERYRRSVRGFAKSAPKKVFDQLVATPIETLRKIVNKLNDSSLNSIRKKYLKKFSENIIKIFSHELISIFGKNLLIQKYPQIQVHVGKKNSTKTKRALSNNAVYYIQTTYLWAISDIG